MRTTSIERDISDETEQAPLLADLHLLDAQFTMTVL
jgi:hypothetical protein